MQAEKQIRTLKECEVRAEKSEGKRYIFGFIPYNSRSRRMTNLHYSRCQYEMLTNKVFNKTLGDNANVYANFSHDDTKILGSTKSNTLILESREDGLMCRCEIPDTSWGDDAFEIVNSRRVTTMSFEFIPYEWDEDSLTNTVSIRSAKLLAVSFCVANPAYVETDSYSLLRSFDGVDLDKVENKDKEEIQKLIRCLSDLINDDDKSEEENAPSEQSIDTQTEVESRSDESEKERADEEAEKQKAEAVEKEKQEREKLALELELSLSL